MKTSIKFAYDGRYFHGYARQPNLETVEGKIIETLIENKLIKSLKETKLRTASRTDKAVSAYCNVISFNTNKINSNILDILSSRSSNIIFYAYTEVDNDFNPRYAKQRQYRYYLKSKDIDIEKLISASSVFTGKHDFTNFARVEDHRSPIRSVDNIIFSELGDYLVIDFYAQTYLWQQIRRIVSALEKIGKGKLDPKQLKEALENPTIKVDFGVASPEYLILKDIVYDINFNYNEELLNKAKELEQKIISSI